MAKMVQVKGYTRSAPTRKKSNTMKEHDLKSFGQHFTRQGAWVRPEGGGKDKFIRLPKQKKGK